MKVYISRQPEKYGGGSNTFVRNFHAYAPRHGIRMVNRIVDADMAIVIANRGVTPDDLSRLDGRKCYIVHRIDEHFGAFVDENRVKKHEMIKTLNRYAAMTVYQSDFVKRTAQPYLQSKKYRVILNGGDPSCFYPKKRPGSQIGHVTWSLLEKKGLKEVLEQIGKRPEETFRLVGVHESALDVGLNFRLPNAVVRGHCANARMRAEFNNMKALFFPSRDDPCPNTVIEAILSGVPVCYHQSGGTPELVGDCGEPLEKFDQMLSDLDTYRSRCLDRKDLDFSHVIEQYKALPQS